MGNKLEGLPALAFIQLAVANDTEHAIRPPRQLMRQRHAAGDGNPCPSEPVVASTPRVFSRSGWLGSRVPFWFSVLSSSIGKYPLIANVLYSAGPA